jgi:hypothetical protein
VRKMSKGADDSYYASVVTKSRSVFPHAPR